MNKSRILKYLPIIAIVTVSTFFIATGQQEQFDFEIIRSNYEAIKSYIELNPNYSKLLYSFIYICVVVFSIPVASLVSIFAGLFFDPITALLLVISSACIGSVIFYFSLSLIRNDLNNESKMGKMIGKMQDGFRKNDFLYLLLLRLLPIFPFWGVNIAAALFQVPIHKFIAATFFGIIPGTYIYTGFGQELKGIINQPNLSPELVFTPKIIMLFALLGILTIGAILYKKLHE